MKSRSRGGRRPSALLIGLCLILGGVIYLELSFGPSHPAASPIAPDPPEPAVLLVADPGFTMKPLDDFSEIARRPLFIPSRRPLPPDTEPPRPGPRKAERHRFTLKGVVIVGDERMAVLVIQRRRSRTVLRVVEGQQIDGWLVEAILPDRVVLRQGETREEVALRDILKAPSRAKVRTVEPGTPTAPAAKRVSPTEAGEQDRPAGRPPSKSSGK
ncbi:MAG: hypothetical protein IH878_05125 [Gemmatimonadetes bacterium]|nr:hypothetical protein [Gemmatimonadota bacterium]